MSNLASKTEATTADLDAYFYSVIDGLDRKIKLRNIPLAGALIAAKADGRVVTDGAMTVSGNTVQCPITQPFVSTDVGKLIDVNEAGASASSYYNNLTGTITAYISASQVTVSFTCLHTVTAAQVVFGTDNTAGIAAQITVAGVGGEVVFPPGIYMISGVLTPLARQTWSGAGKGVSIIYQMGVLRSSSGSAYTAINIADGIHDVTLRDFSLRGTNLQAAGVTGAVAYGVVLGTGAGGAIYNTTFQSIEVAYIFGLGLRCAGDVGDQAGSAATVINTRVLNCDAHHCSDNGVNLNTGGSLEVSGCNLTDNGAGGIEFAGSRFNAHHNYIARNRNVGVGLGGLGNPSLGKDNLLSQNLIERNGASGSGAGVQVGGNVVHAIISNNIVRENELNGIAVTDGNPNFASLSRDVRIVNNQVISNCKAVVGAGISVGMNDVVVESNDVFDDGVSGYGQYYGILCENDSVKLLRNRVRNNTSYDYVFVRNTNSLLVRDDSVGTTFIYEPNGLAGTVDTSTTTATWKSGDLFDTRWVGVPFKIASVYYVISAVAAAPTGNFTVSGLTVTRTSGPNFTSAWIGKYIRLGASLYFPISAVADASHLTITNSIGNTVPASGAWTLNGSVSLTLTGSAGTQTGAAYIVPPHVVYPTPIGRECLLPPITVKTNTGTKQPLYLVPSGRSFLPTRIMTRNASASLAAMGADLTFGFNAGADDVASISSSNLSGVNSATLAVGTATYAPAGSVPTKIGAAGDVLGCLFNDATITATLVVDVFGYFY